MPGGAGSGPDRARRLQLTAERGSQYRETALIVWRITSARLADSAFDGEGARLWGGRWNHPGTAVVYTSGTLALAALEVFVHLEPDIAPDDLMAIAAEIPDSLTISRLEPTDLPAGWRSYPAPHHLQSLGTSWARKRETVALSTPSAIIPAECNFLLNPRHPDFKQLRLRAAEAFAFDPRMWK